MGPKEEWNNFYTKNKFIVHVHILLNFLKVEFNEWFQEEEKSITIHLQIQNVILVSLNNKNLESDIRSESWKIREAE